MEQQARIFTLSNGIRVAYLYSKSPVAYCALNINTGTRDELTPEHGMAHFLEHTLFKGTHKRKAYHINNRLENVGGELNAFTTKEETVLHAVVLKSDLPKAIELISDIAFNSVFPEKEILKEKTVIYDEIDSYRDSPADLIFDDFEDLLFAGSSLGRNTLGTKRSIKSFTVADIRNFVARTYNTDQMVFTVVAKTPFAKIQNWCEKFLGNQATNNRMHQRQAIQPYSAFTTKINKSTYQAHCIIGNQAYGVESPKRTTLNLLNNILGGPMSNSLLNNVLREKHGLVYNIETNYTPYSNTGSFSIYFGTSKQNLDKSMELVNAELKKLTEIPLTSLQLHKAKKQFIGQLAIAYENYEHQMLSMGKSLLVLNKYEPMKEVYRRIQEISAQQLIEVAKEVFEPSRLSTLIYV